MGDQQISHGEMASDTYTHGHDDAVLRSHRWRTADNSAAYLLGELRPGMRLLDVGCGPGTLTADLARRVAPGNTVGIDVEPAVVAEAMTAGAGVPGLTFVAGDFRDLGVGAGAVPGGDRGGASADGRAEAGAVVGSGGFDVVHAHQVLQHLRDPIGALRAMADLAAPGGIVAARDADYSAMTWWPAEPLLDEWRRVYLAVTERNGAQADAGRWLNHWAHEAHLVDVVYTTSTWTFATATDRSWWSQLWADRITSTRLAEQAVEYGIATRAQLAAIADGWRSWASHDDAVFVVVHGEVVAHPPLR